MLRLILIIACFATAKAFVLPASTPLRITSRSTTSPHRIPRMILSSTQDSHDDDDEECDVSMVMDTEQAQMQMAKFSTLPRHESSDQVEVNQVLTKMEKAIQDLYIASANSSSSCKHTHEDWKVDNSYSLGSDSEKVFANAYVDLGKVSCSVSIIEHIDQ